MNNASVQRRTRLQEGPGLPFLPAAEVLGLNGGVPSWGVGGRGSPDLGRQSEPFTLSSWGEPG